MQLSRPPNPGAMTNQQQMNRMGGPGSIQIKGGAQQQQQMNVGPMGAQGSMQMKGGSQQQQQMGVGMPMSAQQQQQSQKVGNIPMGAKSREVIWEGELQWKDNVKVDNNQVDNIKLPSRFYVAVMIHAIIAGQDSAHRHVLGYDLEGRWQPRSEVGQLAEKADHANDSENFGSNHWWALL